MKLSSLFEEDSVLVHREATSLREVIRQMLDTMREELDGPALDRLAEKMDERERTHPTIVAERICLPHLRTDKVMHFRAGLAVLEHPIAHPGEPDHKVDVVFLVLAPQDQNTLMLQTLAAVQRGLAIKGFISSLRGVRSSARLIRLIEESGVEVKRSLCAKDIMEPIGHSLRLDTPLDKAVATLAEARDEGVPVFDDRERLVGELTTREVLILGMPRYMDLISNPEILSVFEPFENYFQHEHELRVKDICRRDFDVVTPDTLVVTVAHHMIAENRRRVYVVADDKVEGVIYRKSILTRVMNQ